MYNKDLKNTSTVFSKVFFLLSFLFSAYNSYPVGVTEIDPNDEISLSFNTFNGGQYNFFMRYNASEEERLYVSMKENEVLYFGFQFAIGGANNRPMARDNVFVRVLDETGNIVFGPEEVVEGEQGFIEDWDAADQGPNQLSGNGYDAFEFTAPAAGDYYIEIGYGGNGATDEFDQLRINNNQRATHFTANYYDFTVASPAGVEQPGRVWSRAWHMVARDGFETEVENHQFIYTDDGIISELDFNGMRPYQWVIVSNGTGVQNTGDVEDDRQSIQSPRGDELIPQYRLFYDLPDTTIFEIADLDELFGELYSPATITGCPGQYCINLDVSKPLRAIITLDVNGTPGFQENTSDLMMEKDLDVGPNCIEWDGNDGEGNPVTTAEVEIEIVFIAGITHLPMFDVEFAPDGLEASFVYPTEIAGPSGIYWDDSRIGGSVNTNDPCFTNCHQWDNNYGDTRIINSWWFIEKDPEVVELEVVPPQLTVSNDTSVCIGDTVTVWAQTDGYLRWMENGEEISTDDTLSFALEESQTLTAEAHYNLDNFLFNSTFEAGNESFESDYDYIATGNFNYGAYIIRTSAQEGFPQQMADLRDHTTGTGNMMIVDGDTVEGSVVYKNTVNVRAGELYNFSAWVSNINFVVDNPPYLQFRINGRELGELELTNEIGWREFYTIWESNTTGQIDVEIINKNTVPSGNDFALDDIFFGNVATCYLTEDVELEAREAVEAMIQISPVDTSTCGSAEITFSIADSANLGNSPTLEWYLNNVLQTSGETYTNSSFADGDSVELRVESSIQGCIQPFDTSESVVTIFDPPLIEISPLDTVCIGESLELTAQSDKPITSWTWIGNVDNLSTTDGPVTTTSDTVSTSYGLVVVDEDGCVDTTEVDFNVKPLPEVDAGEDVGICSSASAQLESVNTHATYDWAPANILSDPTIRNPVASPVSTITEVYLTAIGNNGCVNSDTLIITLADKPIASIQTPDPICIGDTTQLSASCDKTVAEWDWIAGTANMSATNIPDPLVWDNTETDYTLVVTDIDGCKDTTSTTLEVNPLPSVDAGPNQETCGGTTIQLESPTSLSAYQWLPSSIMNDASVSNPIAEPTEDSTSIILIGTDVNGCENSDTLSIVLFQNPEVIIDPIDPICIGDTAIISASSSKVIDSWTWDNQNTLIGDLDTSSVLSIASATTEYTLNVIDEDGCEGSVTSTVVVNPLPYVDAGDNQELCDGLDFQLNSPTNLDSYTWSPTTIFSNSNTVRNPVASPGIGETVVNLVGIDANGCINEDSLTLTVFENPIVTIDPITPICIGKTAAISASSSKTASSWRWIENTDGLSSTIISNPSSDASTTTEYTVTVTDTDGCKDTTSAELVVNPLPDITLNPTTTVCLGETAQLDVNGSNLVSYQWSPAATLSDPTISNPIAQPTSDGNKYYRVDVVDVNGCENNDRVMIRVLDNPIPRIEIGYDTDICSGDTIRAYITDSLYLGANPDYRWNKIDLNNDTSIIATNVTSVRLINFEDGEQVRLEVDSKEKCVAPENIPTYSNVIAPRVYLYPDLSITGDTLVCYGDAITLDANDANNLANMYVWLDAVESSYIDTSIAGEYTFDPATQSMTLRVYASNPNFNCASTSPPHSFIVVRPFIDLKADRDTILIGGTVNLNVATNTDSFSWVLNPLNDNGIQDNLLQTIQTPQVTTIYTVEGTRFGCPARDTATVVVLPPISAPYLFSPNDDGENDIWIVKDLLSFPTTSVKIFNRWGMQVKELENRINVWDGMNENGNPVPDGVYYYVVVAETEEESISITGYVTVVH